MTGPQRCDAHGGHVAWVYSEGKLSSPDGKCLTLAAATGLFFRALGVGNEEHEGREACIGKDGLECCGHGKCVWQGPQGWGCEFEPGYLSVWCFPDTDPGPELASEEELRLLEEELQATLRKIDILRALVRSVIKRRPITRKQLKLLRSLIGPVNQMAGDTSSTLLATFPGLDAPALPASKTNFFNVPSSSDDAAAAGGEGPEFQALMAFASQWSDEWSPPDEEGAADVEVEVRSN